MPAIVMPETTDRALCLCVEGTPEPENFKITRDACEKILKRHGEIRFLLYFKDFGKWSEETSQMDMGFTLEYGPKITRLALVNPPPHIISLFKIKEGLFKQQIRYCAEEEFANALAWVNAE